MRKTRTKNEQLAIDAVKSVLKENLFSVIDDLDVVDKPDWVFAIDGKKIAADCCHLSMERAMSWSKTIKRLKHGKAYEIIIPNEPHIWLRQTIENKQKRIKEYTDRSGAQEVWLIVHSDLLEFPFFEFDSVTIDLLKRSAASMDSSFSKIWFVYKGEKAFSLWEKGHPKIDFPELDLNNGYPIITKIQARDTLTQRGLTFDAGRRNIVETVRLQPLDKRYRLLYLK